MTLLTGQLLFVERHDETLRLDLVVLERVDAPRSPAVGQPIALDLALPGDVPWREALERQLHRWAEASTVVDLDIVERPGRTCVRVSSTLSAVMLEEPHRT
jgi:hypothetical protein